MADQPKTAPLSDRIRRARLSNAWTQDQLAQKLSASQGAVANWELGKTRPTAKNLARIEEILGITPDALGEDGESRATEGDSSLFRAWVNATRLARQWSIPELARRSGISSPAVYAIESGKIANPRAETVRRIEQALGEEFPKEAKEELEEESTIQGVGQLVDFDPHNDDDRPSVSGIYVLYDISERPVYVGEGKDIRKRILDHEEKFWFKRPIVETAAYVEIPEDQLRRKIETVLIRFLKSNAVINKQNVNR